MTTIEIKKLLYKQKPKAKFQLIRHNNVYYSTIVTFGDKIKETKAIIFEIPITDLSGGEFHPEMEAQHLNRWIVE